MNAFMLKAEEVARRLDVTLQNGLSDAEIEPVVNATAKTSSAAVRRFRFGNGFYRRSPNR